MKVITKTLWIAVIAGGLAAALMAALSVGSLVSSESARAGPGITVGLDMDPAGNFCSGPNTDCTLGSIDQCISVPNTPSFEFDIDLFVDGLTNGFVGWNENLYFPNSQFIVQADGLTDPAFVLIAQSTGSDPIDLSESVPDPPGGGPEEGGPGSPHRVGVIDFGASETTPPFTKGVLNRFTLKVAAGAAPGIYGLTLAGPPMAAYVDDDANAYDVSDKWDANSSPQYGLVALGLPCGTPTPPPDVDGDGIPDAEDACPEDAEDFDGFRDGDGCPEPCPGGDVDGDGRVDFRDVRLVAHALGTGPGQPRWNPAADLNHNGRVDVADLLFVLRSSFDVTCRR